MYKNTKKLIEILKNKKITLSVVESCTGGKLAQLLTSISGASKVFDFGMVTYSNQSKIRHLKVPAKLIQKYGAVSKNCCTTMVKNLSKISKSKLNIAITGIAGPRGGSKLKPVGLVYIGLKKKDKIQIHEFFFKNINRESVRTISVKKTIELIRNFI
jgi:nicotinamide-nucleotide amidase